MLDELSSHLTRQYPRIPTRREAYAKRYPLGNPLGL